MTCVGLQFLIHGCKGLGLALMHILGIGHRQRFDVPSLQFS